MLKIVSILLLGVYFVFCKAHAQSVLVFKEGKVLCKKKKYSHLLKVYVGSYPNGDVPENQPQVLGSIENDAFTPYIPFGLNQTYTAVCGTNSLIFKIPLPEDYQLPEVVEIYPTDSILPANLLKFYVRFNKPMATQAYQHIILVDKAGKAIRRGILKEIPALWNEDRTELCVWLEPGRIKQGLGPNKRLGPVMELGNYYSIQISDDLRDAQGIKMSNSFLKKFKTKKEDRTSPDYSKWTIKAPNESTQDALGIHFDESMAYGSVLSALRILNKDGESISGVWEISKNEKSVQFHPTKNWAKGQYQVEIAASAEDLAGNNLNRLFDEKVESKEDKVYNEYCRINFNIN